MFDVRLPLNEIVLDFYDRLKSVSRATLHSIITGWLQRIGFESSWISVGGEPVDALADHSP